VVVMEIQPPPTPQPPDSLSTTAACSEGEYL
jgi:hypothetical protein